MPSAPLFDRVMETSTTTGTGTYTLAGAVTGFQSFSVVGNAQTCHYCAQEVDANGNPSGGWEVGIGTYTVSGTTLSRNSILASSNAGSAVSWSAGTRRIFLTLPAVATARMDAPPLWNYLPGLKPVTVTLAPSIGDNDVYTVPTGRRAWVMFTAITNTSGSNITWTGKLKVSGTYYRVTDDRVVGSRAVPYLNNISTNAAFNIFAEAGDTVAFNCSATAMKIWCLIFEFDASSPLKSARKLGLSTGDNTVYTCPAGKVATLVALSSSAFSTAMFGLCGGQTGNWVMDTTGRSYYFNIVPSGGSPSSANRVTQALTGVVRRADTTLFTCVLAAGDFININVDTGNAAQYGLVNLLELDA